MQSVYEATAVLANNTHLSDQVRDLQPPHHNLQVNVAGAYRTVVEAHIGVARMQTVKARALFGEELYHHTGSRTSLPVVFGMFGGDPLLIDGIHRINDAANAGTEFIPYFLLSADQTAAITSARSL